LVLSEPAQANHALGFEDDLRTYEVAADIIRSLGIQSVTLLSNNPKKWTGLAENGVEVTARQPLVIAANPHNASYLATKRTKSGHKL
jgi:GTP cyclohydrolase II